MAREPKAPSAVRQAERIPPHEPGRGEKAEPGPEKWRTREQRRRFVQNRGEPGQPRWCLLTYYAPRVGFVCQPNGRALDKGGPRPRDTHTHPALQHSRSMSGEACLLGHPTLAHFGPATSAMGPATITSVAVPNSVQMPNSEGRLSHPSAQFGYTAWYLATWSRSPAE